MQVLSIVGEGRLVFCKFILAKWAFLESKICCQNAPKRTKSHIDFFYGGNTPGPHSAGGSDPRPIGGEGREWVGGREWDGQGRGQRKGKERGVGGGEGNGGGGREEGRGRGKRVRDRGGRCCTHYSKQKSVPMNLEILYVLSFTNSGVVKPVFVYGACPETKTVENKNAKEHYHGRWVNVNYR
jgi:hypothetical protein